MQYQDIFERKELKYLLTEETYRKLRKELDRFMAVDQYGETTILNIYYDTPDSRLIRRSLEKPVYKEKLRLRCYGVPGSDSPAFLEIKKKYRKTVYKRRIGMPYSEAAGFMDRNQADRQLPQIGREIQYFKRFYRDLEPKMVIACERTAMAGICDPELRITFDRNIRWRDRDLDLRLGSSGKPVLEKGRILMEVKVKDALSWELVKLFSRLQIRSCSFSKYGEAYRQQFAEEAERKAEQKERQRFRGALYGQAVYSGVHHSLVSA